MNNLSENIAMFPGSLEAQYCQDVFLQDFLLGLYVSVNSWQNYQ